MRRKRRKSFKRKRRGGSRRPLPRYIDTRGGVRL